MPWGWSALRRSSQQLRGQESLLSRLAQAENQANCSELSTQTPTPSSLPRNGSVDRARAKIADFAKAHGEHFADGLFKCDIVFHPSSGELKVILRHTVNGSSGGIVLAEDEVLALTGSYTSIARGVRLITDMITKAIGVPSAEQRAEATLKEHLSPIQRASYEQFGWFVVTGNSTGRNYRIAKGRHSNIYRLSKTGADERRLCFTSQDVTVPTADILLMQKLSLECDEQAALAVTHDQGPIWTEEDWDGIIAQYEAPRAPWLQYP
jgi:hypothetical protein